MFNDNTALFYFLILQSRINAITDREDQVSNSGANFTWKPLSVKLRPSTLLLKSAGPEKRAGYVSFMLNKEVMQFCFFILQSASTLLLKSACSETKSWLCIFYILVAKLLG
ncbi:5972_t:CDS:2 [Dentiscutata erythropus]|uniref:5972_t:CDS:1 n=1 Tax=Dentiscutata erythropus TaxID=1348616 RepID=A0A9N9B0F4_9GLOM|nr:5972_t:CDS:2 [Dentiscutata erythropus]